MARKKSTSEGLDWKALVGEEKEFFRVVVQEVVQQVLESEMENCCRRARGNARKPAKGTAVAITAGRW